MARDSGKSLFSNFYVGRNKAFYSILFYFILFYSILFYSTLPHLILSYPILSYPILSYHIISYRILFCFILFYLILFHSIILYLFNSQQREPSPTKRVGPPPYKRPLISPFPVHLSSWSRRLPAQILCCTNIYNFLVCWCNYAGKHFPFLHTH